MAEAVQVLLQQAFLVVCGGCDDPVQGTVGLVGEPVVANRQGPECEPGRARAAARQHQPQQPLGGVRLLDQSAGVGFDLGGVRQAGSRQQMEPAPVFVFDVAAFDEAAEQVSTFGGAGVGDGHAQDVLPLVVCVRT
ncbi:hypothetical protein ACWGLE_12930 [Streptomyces sp. NPDC055897]